MANTIFFAWQLDTPSDQNKQFIWRALEAASATNANNLAPEASPRPERDTTGLSGNPNIVESIFQRIKACAFFVADLTFTAQTEAGKRVPNGNVLIELGYAARSIGWERTILVMNDRYGKPEHLPFDLRQHRWPIVYRGSNEEATAQKRLTELTLQIQRAVAACAQHTLERASDMADSIDAGTLSIIAQFEQHDFFDMKLLATKMGQVIAGIDRLLAIRQLIAIGAVRVTHTPTMGYTWTYDGRCMIEALKRKQPRVLEVVRAHLQAKPTKPTST